VTQFASEGDLLKTNMSNSIQVYVQWSEQTVALFKAQQMRIGWTDKELMTIRCPEPPLSVEDMATWIESRVEGLYEKQTQGEDRAQVQIRWIKKEGANEQMPWGDDARKYLSDGDKIVVDAMAMLESMAMRRGPRLTEEQLEKVRKMLRFGLNDRVLCYCGPRWLSGHVVGTAVEDEDGVLPYLVKTDPIPGLPAKTISVPKDVDEICAQEVCFDPWTQLELVKCAATILKGDTKPKLRFAEGDKVAVRIRNAPDGLECWISGKVAALWPKLPGDTKWAIDNISGEFPSEVAYRVDLVPQGWVFVHRDHHTLIRREGMQPKERVKGISKRIELRKNDDGSREQIDHQTERRKRMLEIADDDSD